MDRFDNGIVDIQELPYCTWCYEVINDSVEYGGLCKGCYKDRQENYDIDEIFEEFEEDDSDD